MKISLLKKMKLNKVLVLICMIAMGLFLLSGCGKEVEPEVPETEIDNNTPDTDIQNVENEGEGEEEGSGEPEIDIENSALYEMVSEDFFDEDLIAGEVDFDDDDAINYGKRVHCLFDMPTQQMIFQCKFNKIPSSDDTQVYLFILNPWDDESKIGEMYPYASVRKGHTVQVELPYNRTYLFARFVPALLVNGEYKAVSNGKYIGNPNLLALNQEEEPVYTSKKGILLDPATVGTDKLDDLNVKRIIYNIPLSLILGESSNPDIATTVYEYDGHTYYFNTTNLYAYDTLFKYLSDNGYYTTAIILNDWNEVYPELIHPMSRQKTSKSLYYAFNTVEEDGIRAMEATALFLAERYSSGWYGRVYDWVIANEINQQTTWNYMDTTDVNYYTESFEKCFRIFYNAIKSQYANAHVYFSIDHDWNDNRGNTNKWFNGKEVLEVFNRAALKGGNYDWGLAIHPYPNPLTRVNFWTGNYDMSEDAAILTIMNLSTVTNILEKGNYRDTAGGVRKLAITELGFTSASGERLQAAAFAYCYSIIDNNPYVESFMMNRQTDAYEEMKAGLDFGVYNMDFTPKYLAEVFANIDTTESDKYYDAMLKVIKAESMEEALAWATP